jgi:formylglycine-generating enzyme required for sulfatase activity
MAHGNTTIRRLRRYVIPTCLLFTLTTMLLSLSRPTLAGTDTQRGVAIHPMAPTGEEVKGDLWLLTIGINSYLSWPRLKTAVNDARAIKNVLLARYHLESSHVIELTDEQATRHNILAAFRDLAKKVKPEDSLLVYYAGHGHVDSITGKGSWIPVESGTDDPTAWLGNRDVTDYLSVNAIKARHVLLVSDSCFSGDFFRGSRGALPTIDDAFLKKAYSRSSRQAISSGGLEPVSDAGFGGNSVFSHFLVTALNSNSKLYLVPSELFGEVRAGVGKNADQLPQFGDLHGVGGQDGGEMILFLKGESRLQDLSGASASRQQELEQLRKAETAAAAAKKKEQQEIAKKQAELDDLDKQIAEMKSRLGSGAARSGDSLDQIIALAEQKEQQGEKLEALRLQRNAEEKQRQQELARLKRESVTKRAEQIKVDLAKYQKVAQSKFASDMAGSAWDALLASYPEAKGIAPGERDVFLQAVGLIPRVIKDTSTGMSFVAVPGGCYQREGSEVCVNDISIGKYEVTQGEWLKVMGSNPSHFSSCGANCPVEQVSWDDVQEYIRKLNGLSGTNYRLPTEAEWEYAARIGGEAEEYSGGNDVNAVAWYSGNSGGNTHPVGQKQPNRLGLYDMSGNVWEWCNDWHGGYASGRQQNPTGPTSGHYRVNRGGSWYDFPANVRASFRSDFAPDFRYRNLGFRLVSLAVR